MLEAVIKECCKGQTCTLFHNYELKYEHSALLSDNSALQNFKVSTHSYAWSVHTFVSNTTWIVLPETQQE